VYPGSGYEEKILRFLSLLIRFEQSIRFLHCSFQVLICFDQFPGSSLLQRSIVQSSGTSIVTQEHQVKFLVLIFSGFRNWYQNGDKNSGPEFSSVLISFVQSSYLFWSEQNWTWEQIFNYNKQTDEWNLMFHEQLAISYQNRIEPENSSMALSQHKSSGRHVFCHGHVQFNLNFQLHNIQFHSHSYKLWIFSYTIFSDTIFSYTIFIIKNTISSYTWATNTSTHTTPSLTSSNLYICKEQVILREWTTDT
jgi:hypothetical protein